MNNNYYFNFIYNIYNVCNKKFDVNKNKIDLNKKYMDNTNINNMSSQIISIEGNIGSGKSSFLSYL